MQEVAICISAIRNHIAIGAHACTKSLTCDAETDEYSSLLHPELWLVLLPSYRLE